MRKVWQHPIAEIPQPRTKVDQIEEARESKLEAAKLNEREREEEESSPLSVSSVSNATGIGISFSLSPSLGRLPPDIKERERENQWLTPYTLKLELPISC